MWFVFTIPWYCGKYSTVINSSPCVSALVLSFDFWMNKQWPTKIQAASAVEMSLYVYVSLMKLREFEIYFTEDFSHNHTQTYVTIPSLHPLYVHLPRHLPNWYFMLQWCPTKVQWDNCVSLWSLLGASYQTGFTKLMSAVTPLTKKKIRVSTWLLSVQQVASSWNKCNVILNISHVLSITHTAQTHTHVYRYFHILFLTKISKSTMCSFDTIQVIWSWLASIVVNTSIGNNWCITKWSIHIN